MLKNLKLLAKGFGEVKVLCTWSDLIDNRLNDLPCMRLRLPETGLDANNSGKQVAGIVVTLDERVTLQLFNG